MQKFEENHARPFRSTGEMIASVTGGDPVVATCPCTLKLEEKTNWLLVVAGIIVVVIVRVALEASGAGGVAAIIFLALMVVGGFFAIRAFLQGQRSAADAMVISNQNVYLFKDVGFNKKTNVFTFGAAYKVARNELKKKFLLQLFGSAIRFKAGDMTGLATKPGRGKAQQYNSGNVVSVKEAKNLLFP